jgi:wyosine [tRNA(Phe)-imidazoG37] synthetase (radical SAM superfamily)
MHLFKHIFGPVPSRRLGVSLGIDLVPHKVCTLNCIYCEVGYTTKLTLERKEYVKYNNVINELDLKLSSSPKLDYITFSGAGEPTLNNRLGDIIHYIKKNYSQYKIAVLTNGTLFSEISVRNECLEADLIIPSLDAITSKKFTQINRPHHSLDNKIIIDGLIELRKQFKKEIWLEIFLIPGLNDTDSEIGLLKENILKIKPDKVQLNSLDRPGVEEWVEPISKLRMQSIKRKFKPIEVEAIIRDNLPNVNAAYEKGKESLIISTICRRPCTLDDLKNLTGLKINELNKYLGSLINNKKVKIKHIKGENFYASNI